MNAYPTNNRLSLCDSIDVVVASSYDSNDTSCNSTIVLKADMDPIDLINHNESNCHQRKRSRTSICDQSTTSTLSHTRQITESLPDIDNEPLASHGGGDDDDDDDNDDDLSSQNASTNNAVLSSLDSLKLTKLDSEFSDLVSRYVGSEHVVHCLELAGFCTHYVLVCLDEVQLQRLEEFVRHACSVMKSVTLREYFTGPLFARDPAQFKLPSGAICGLLLAVNEFRKRHCFQSALDASDTTINVSSRVGAQPMKDATCQTQIPCLPYVTDKNLASEPFNPSLNTGRLTAMCNMGFGTTMSETAKPNTAGTNRSVDYSNTSLAASTYVNESPFLQSNNNSTDHSQSPNMNCNGSENGPVSSGSNHSTSDAQTPSISNHNHAMSCSNGPFIDDDVVDLHRLKQHSSASAIRLASRQFANAYLVRGRDFDMEMELSVGQEGCKRVTGIFYCHLCKEKRERTSAVRFSIARNRYPVLSNVLSHLKTHFFYRGQSLTASQTNAAAVLQHTSNLIKSANILGESFVGQDLFQSLGTTTYTTTESSADQLIMPNSTSSFISPSTLSNQLFSAHVKAEPIAFPFAIDNEGVAEDSSTDQIIFDNLSPSNSDFNSPSRKKTEVNHYSRHVSVDNCNVNASATNRS